jgi:hypothetical protein
MKEYKQFVNLLECELQSFLSKPNEEWNETALKYVDGFAADELRRLVNIEVRRENGTFFTNSELGKKILSLLKPNFNKGSIVYDPACGASNLLISVADFVRTENKISNFENSLLGTDIHEEFVEASRLRLQMNQLIYNVDSLNKEKIETNIIKADGLLPNQFYQSATHIIVNPPFNLIPSNNQVTWAKGKVCAAAVFIDKIIQHSKPGVSIIAILPDVLRSGSRYDKWRTLVEQTCIIEKVKLLGQFDEYADVDVFAIKISKRQKIVKLNAINKKWQSDNTIYKKTISDLFDICVGPVVDNRDPHNGVSRKYIISRGLQGWKETIDVNLNRKHEGKSFISPFIVIKRTSRASDIHRAVATIINISEPIYVDNHLIILKPKSGKITDCRKVLKLLKEKKTDNWINAQIRCRHLTVKVVSKIPFLITPKKINNE